LPAAAISIAEDEEEPRKQKKREKKTKRQRERGGGGKKNTFLQIGMGDGNNKTGCVEEWLATAIPPATSSASVRGSSQM
jgi:hypothetical protein